MLVSIYEFFFQLKSHIFRSVLLLYMHINPVQSSLSVDTVHCDYSVSTITESDEIVVVGLIFFSD